MAHGSKCRVILARPEPSASGAFCVSNERGRHHGRGFVVAICERADISVGGRSTQWVLAITSAPQTGSRRSIVLRIVVSIVPIVFSIASHCSCAGGFFLIGSIRCIADRPAFSLQIHCILFCSGDRPLIAKAQRQQRHRMNWVCSARPRKWLRRIPAGAPKLCCHADPFFGRTRDQFDCRGARRAVATTATMAAAKPEAAPTPSAQRGP